MSAIAGFLSIESGTINLNDVQISGLEPRDVPCALLFQDNNLFPNLCVFDNVASE